MHCVCHDTVARCACVAHSMNAIGLRSTWFVISNEFESCMVVFVVKIECVCCPLSYHINMKNSIFCPARCSA